MDYLEYFKANIKLRKSHNGAVGYHPGLPLIVMQEKHNITRETANKEKNIETKIKTR